MLMETNTKCPACRFLKRDCNSYSDGYCISLDSLNRKWKSCPFYKSDEQFKQEEQRTIGRLKALGLDHLIRRKGDVGN